MFCSSHHTSKLNWLQLQHDAMHLPSLETPRSASVAVVMITLWAMANNLRLNRDKTKEIVFSACHKRVPRRCHRLIRTSSALRVCASSASSWTTGWRLPTTSQHCCRRAAAWCTQCVCCACTDCRTHRYRMYSVLLSFRTSSTRRLRGLACALPLTAYISTRCCDAASGWVIAGSTSRPSWTCSVQRMMTFSVASSRTVITSFSLICLTIMKFHTSCAHDPTPWLWSIKLNSWMTLTSSSAYCTSTLTNPELMSWH